MGYKSRNLYATGWCPKSATCAEFTKLCKTCVKFCYFRKKVKK